MQETPAEVMHVKTIRNRTYVLIGFLHHGSTKQKYEFAKHSLIRLLDTGKVPTNY